MSVDKESTFLKLTLEGEIITSETVSTEEVSNIITTMKKEKNVLCPSTGRKNIPNQRH